MLKMFYSLSQFEKNTALPTEKFLSLALLWNVIMSQHFIIQRVLYYLSSGHLQEVKTNESPKSGRGRLQEMAA